MRSSLYALVLAAGLGAAVFAPGCHPDPGYGPAAAPFTLGALEVDVAKPIDDVNRAVLTAMSDLNLNVTEHAKDSFGAHVVAKEAEGGDIKVNMVANSPAITRISIRVGLLGDEGKSRRILRAIQDKL